MIARILFLLFGLGLSASLFGATVQELTQRMQERLPDIIELKEEGLIGENNKGYLEARGDLTPAQTELIGAENDDRRAIYAKVADQQGTKAEVVGKIRARQIQQREPAGFWVQAEDGTWKRK